MGWGGGRIGGGWGGGGEGTVGLSLNHVDCKKIFLFIYII